MINWLKVLVAALRENGGRAVNTERVTGNDLAAQMRAVEARLKSARQTPAAPADLHDSIMRAVRRSSRVAERPPVRRLRWQLGFGVAAACLAIVSWLVFRPAAPPQPISLSAATLERTQVLAQEAPAKALSPLSQELDALKRDLDGAVEFVIASVP